MTIKQTILAIDPGLREIGVAHFGGNELLDYGVKSLRRPGNANKRAALLCEVVVRLIEEKRPDIFSLEKNSFANVPQNQNLVRAVEKLKQIVREAGVPIFEFAPNTIKKEITNDGRASKRQVAHVLSARYPELKAYRESNRRWRERYYQNMFDAVACGLTYLKLHDENRLH